MGFLFSLQQFFSLFQVIHNIFYTHSIAKAPPALLKIHFAFVHTRRDRGKVWMKGVCVCAKKAMFYKLIYKQKSHFNAEMKA